MKRSPGTADEWDGHWDSFGDVAESSPANLYRERLVLDWLADLQAGDHVLDIGSGQGELILAIAARYPSATLRGLENSPVGVARGQARARELGAPVEFAQRDLLTDPVPESELRWADRAVCSEVLEHLDDPVSFLQHVSPYLKAGCPLLVTVPAGPRSALDRYIGHRRHFTPAALRNVLVDAGFEPMDIRRAGFPFFNLYRLVVILRGQALIADLDRSGPASSSPGRRAAVGVALEMFERLFALNSSNSPFGWQLVAAARVPV